MKATTSYSLRERQTQKQLLIDIMTSISSFVSPDSDSFTLYSLIRAVELANGGCLIMPYVQVYDEFQVQQSHIYSQSKDRDGAMHYYVADVVVSMIAPDDELSHKVIDALNLGNKYAPATEISLEDYLQATKPAAKAKA